MRLIYTLGTSTHPVPEFLMLLQKLRVEADVRHFPTGRFPHFSRENLASLAEGQGMRYIYRGGKLGGIVRGATRPLPQPPV